MIYISSSFQVLRFCVKGTSKVGEWEGEFQVVPCNHNVFNDKLSSESKSDIILGAYKKENQHGPPGGKGLSRAATSLVLCVAGNNKECLMWSNVWTRRENHLASILP